jgi:hypothetical protein
MIHKFKPKSILWRKGDPELNVIIIDRVYYTNDGKIIVRYDATLKTEQGSTPVKVSDPLLRDLYELIF